MKKMLAVLLAMALSLSTGSALAVNVYAAENVVISGNIADQIVLEPSVKTATFQNVVVSGMQGGYPLHISKINDEGTITLIFEGRNELIADAGTASKFPVHAIYAERSVEIIVKDGGSLTAKGAWSPQSPDDDGADGGNGIYVDGDLTIRGSGVTAQGGNGGNGKYSDFTSGNNSNGGNGGDGIYVTGNLTMHNGASATGGDGGYGSGWVGRGGDGGRGIYAGGDVKVLGGETSAEGGDCGSSYVRHAKGGDGISAKSIELDGTVNAQGGKGDKNGIGGNGVTASGDVTIRGALTAAGGNAQFTDYLQGDGGHGVVASGDVTVLGSATAQGGHGGENRTGKGKTGGDAIRAGGCAVIRGSVTATGGNGGKGGEGVFNSNGYSGGDGGSGVIASGGIELKGSVTAQGGTGGEGGEPDRESSVQTYPGPAGNPGTPGSFTGAQQALDLDQSDRVFRFEMENPPDDPDEPDEPDNPDNPADLPETGSLPQTGDPSMLGAWIALLGMSAAGLKLRKRG